MSALLEMDFLRDALVASLLIGLMLSVLGVFVVMRRIVFVGAALSQASAAGVALALFVGGLLYSAGAPAAAEFLEHHPETIAIFATICGAALLSIRPRRVNLPSEGAIGLGYALASSLAILLVAKAPGGEADTLLLLYGNILAVEPVELLELAVLCPLVLLVRFLFQRQFLMVSFNPETAQAAGVRVWVWNLLFYVTLGVGIAVAIRAAGSLLTFAYLVVPGLAGLMVARKSWQVTALAVAVALSGSVIGILASAWLDLPSGPTVVATLLLEAGGFWAVARVLG